MKRSGEELVEYVMYDNGVTSKTIILRKWHNDRILWERVNLWDSVNGYVKKEF